MKKVVALLAVLALLLAAVVTAGLAIGTLTSDDPEPPRRTSGPEPAEPPPASVTEPPKAGLADFYSQTIDWSPCASDDSHDCGTLTVPVDYRDPTGETFGLNLLRVPADGDRIGSLVVNPGGPGAPGTSYAGAAGLVFRPALLDSFDIVGFDPRGTGRSSPVDCFSDEELDAYVAIDPTPDTADEIADYEQTILGLGADCQANTGEILGHV
ncbi:MAG: alpha/beta hydrolase, partial [Nocardioides sp.]